jgi:hypothetical protein
MAGGIRINGMVTPHADRVLHDYLAALPPGQERGRALKQLATIGLLVSRGQVSGQARVMAAVVAAEPVPVALAEPAELVVKVPASVAPPAPALQGDEPVGNYDLAALDMDDVELSF